MLVNVTFRRDDSNTYTYNAPDDTEVGDTLYVDTQHAKDIPVEVVEVDVIHPTHLVKSANRLEKSPENLAKVETEVEESINNGQSLVNPSNPPLRHFGRRELRDVHFRQRTSDVGVDCYEFDFGDGYTIKVYGTGTPGELQMESKP